MPLLSGLPELPNLSSVYSHAHTRSVESACVKVPLQNAAECRHVEAVYGIFVQTIVRVMANRHMRLGVESSSKIS